MAQTVSLWGATYSNVPALTVPSGNGTVLFADPSITTAVAADVAQGKQFLLADGSIGTGTASGGGGGSGLTLLATKSLGSISTTSTTATNTGQTVSVSSFDDYDIFIVICSVATPTNGRHLATVSVLELYNSSDISTKNSSVVANARTNYKKSSNGTVSSTAGTSAYGIYANNATIMNGGASIPIWQRYHSTNTGTINGTYTARVYGVKLYELIGG